MRDELDIVALVVETHAGWAEDDRAPTGLGASVAIVEWSKWKSEGAGLRRA